MRWFIPAERFCSVYHTTTSSNNKNKAVSAGINDAVTAWQLLQLHIQWYTVEPLRQRQCRDRDTVISIIIKALQQVFITCSNRSVGVYGSRVVCLVTTSRGTLPEDNDKGSIFHRWQDSHWGQETKTHHSHIYCCLNYSTASWKHKRLFWLLF